MKLRTLLAAVGLVSVTLTTHAADFVNVLTGGSMADELDAGGAGGAGDTLRGGKGDDLYYVSNATDVVVEAANEGVDSVRSRIAAFTLADNVENLKYIGAAATLTLTGNARANRIEAGDGAGALYGLGGDDVLVGGSGADTLDGGDGVERIRA